MSVRKGEEDFSSLLNREAKVSVGIVSADIIRFTLLAIYEARGTVTFAEQEVRYDNGYILWKSRYYKELTFIPEHDHGYFEIEDVVIGVDFHWERKEPQKFEGNLRLVAYRGKIRAINIVPVESYLESVISSEMNAHAPIEFLKAHAVISRSWLLAQIERRKKEKANRPNPFTSFSRSDSQLIRWYEREDHTLFDVCADDHCQRYQGVTRVSTRAVKRAVKATRGEVLCHEGAICDARFSKCCGGATEEFSTCWEDDHKPYLEASRDADKEHDILPDLSEEENARAWILSAPDAFCNTDSHQVLQQVLNNYDRETTDFYRWRVEYSQKAVAGLLRRKTKTDFGKIIDLVPLRRGTSGRISLLKVVGTSKTFTIGKELEIRRSLSESHLLSSAFTVERVMADDGGDIPVRFILHGAGWGHGVGLCQIGAAVMAYKGFGYKDILSHYYHHSKIVRLYR